MMIETIAVITAVITLTANAIPLTAGFDKPILYSTCSHNITICIKYTYIPACS